MVRKVKCTNTYKDYPEFVMDSRQEHSGMTN